MIKDFADAAARIDSAFYGVIVGALIAFVGQWLITKHSTKMERLRLRGEKIEALICVLYDYDYWMNGLRQSRVHSPLGVTPLAPEPPSPLPKAEAIAAVHFPEVSQSILELKIIAGDYSQWMFLKGSQKGSSNWDAFEGFKKVFEPYDRKLSDTLQQLNSIAESIHR